MDIEEAKKFARNKIEADALTQQVRDVIKITKWQKQDMREGFKETFKPLIKSQESIKKSIDEQQNATLAQLKANQLALTQGLNRNRLAITEGLEQLPGFKKIEDYDVGKLSSTLEEIEDVKDYNDDYDKKYFKKYDDDDDDDDDEFFSPKSGEEFFPPSKSDEIAKIAKFKPEDLDRNLMNKNAQDILKKNDYYKLPSEYLKEDVSTIDKVIYDVNDDLEETSKAIKNTAIMERDSNGYFLARPLNKNPHENTLNYINKYNILSVYSTNLSNLKYYKTKSGSGIVYFNNPLHLLDRLELLGGSILAGNNGVIPEFSQIAHLLNQMKVISKKQLNDLLKNYLYAV